MRSHLKLSLILAAAIFPTTLFAEGPAAAIVPTSQDLQLNLTQAKAAFHDFQVVAEDKGTMATLYGTTSADCMKAFLIKNDSEKGEFTITLPKGSNSACLDYSKLGEIKEDAGLSKKEGAKLEFTASVSKVVLRGQDPKSDRPSKPDELLDADTGQSIAFISAAEIENQRRADAEAEKAKAVENDYLLAVSCTHGFIELDLRVNAIENLAKVKNFVAREDIGEEWFKKMRKETDDKVFAACRLEITRAKSDDFAECDDRLARLVGKDPEFYGPKVRALYLTMVGRYKSSTALGVNEAYDKAAAMIDTLRGMDLDEEELKAVDAAEQDLLLASLARAAKEGDEAAYADMAEKFKGHLIEHDELGCLDDNAMLAPAKRFTPACRQSGWMSAQLFQSAAINVAMARVQAQKAVAQQYAEQEQMKYSTCQAIKAAGGVSTAECIALENKFTAAASAKANEGISTGNAFAQPVSDDRTPAGSTDSGFMNSSAANNASGYMKSGTNSAPSVTQNAPPAVTPNTTTTVRVFR